MLISHTHAFIFFHVGKAAGISMREILEPHCEEPEKFKIRRPPRTINGRPNRMYEVWQGLLLHAKASDARRELPPEQFERYFKFAFVRNPWDFQVSMYHFIMRQPTYSKYEAVKQLGGFDEYLEWVTATPDPYPKGTPKLQCESLIDAEGELLVDFVGRYERVGQDFDHVCGRLGIQGSLRHLNATPHADYRTYYNERTKRLVADHFKEDIELFGYSFDGHVEVGRT